MWSLLLFFSLCLIIIGLHYILFKRTNKNVVIKEQKDKRKEYK